MEVASTAANPIGWKRFASTLALCAACVVLNYAGTQIASALDLPLYLDCIGVIIAGACGGYIPGIVVGYITNIITSLSDPSSFYWCLTSVLIAVFAAFGAKRGWFNKLSTVLLVILGCTLIGGGIGSVITWCLYGAFDNGALSPFAQQVAEATGTSGFLPQLMSDLVIDLVDKTLTVLIAVLFMQAMPQRIKDLFVLDIWRQAPLEGEKLNAAWHTETHGFSLRTKIVAIVAVVMIIAAIVTTSISFFMFQRSNIEAQGKMGEGIVTLLAEHINPNLIDEYMERGESMRGYVQSERELAHIRDSFPDVEYVYVYQIREDGCHVVFDPDTADEQGSDPGTVIPFDNAFAPHIDALLAGEPIVSNETYGWLLTVYLPVYDRNDDCSCYVAADISMDSLVSDGFAFVSRIIILFSAFFILICAAVIWLAEYGIILPINSISLAAGGFAFDSEEGRKDSVEHLRQLEIRTGDEVENLYHAVTKMSEDTVQFIADSQEKAATIERMQDNLIMVMADLVESRDQHTGDHVRKTAAYTKVIMDQMREEGMYTDVLTDEFVSNVVKSAPLHDIGKISVSDSILNKPGRLTDEEFGIMQGHTTAGKEILEDAVGAMSDPGYLDEAQRLATYHHEKWNGKGYPTGLSGEEIPLSARIMAVADVFDALVSKRSYKEGMPIEKALAIIRDDAGTHFDPQVAAAFLHAEDEVRRIAALHGDDLGTAEDIREGKH